MRPPVLGHRSSVGSIKHLTYHGNRSKLPAPNQIEQPTQESSTMTSRRKNALKAAGVFLAFSFAQVYVLAGLPAPAPGTPQPAITANPATKNNAPITVTGHTAHTRPTILTRA